MRRLTSPRSLAKAVRVEIELEDRWNQGIWLSSGWFKENRDGDKQATGARLRELLTKNVCGTQACVAGHTIVLTLPAKARYDYLEDTVIGEDGSETFAQTYAQKALGLDEEEAEWLFDGYRRKPEVLAALDLLAKGKGLYSLID